MKRICMSVILILICFNQLFAPNVDEYTQEQKKLNKKQIICLNELMSAEFSVDNLREFLILLNAPSPEIILNQAKLETGWFKSRLFIYHNNLFGMHYPRVRETYSDRYTIADNGSKCASYGSWQSSVLDLLIFFEYCENFGYDTTDYYKFLVDVGYCEKNGYVNLLKRMA